MLLTEHLERRYQVFVSSTFKDLIKERDEIRNVLNRSNYIVEGMELFPAANKSQWEIIKERIRASDIYVLVIGANYGSVANNARELEPDLILNDEAISYTRLEFRYVKKLGIPVLAFIKQASIVDKKGILDPNVKSFINEVQTANLTTRSWKDRVDLTTNILSSLQQATASDDFIQKSGWVKVSSLDKTIDPGNDTVYIRNKIQYSKFISYSDKTINPEPLYKKRLLRWFEDSTRKEVEYDVWDEYVALSITQLSHYVSKYQHYCRTDGDALDFASFLPFLNKFEFSDINASWNEKIFTPIINRPSNTYIHTTSYINGFQDGNMDMAIKANKYCENLMLFVDFTSIPNFRNLFKLNRCVKRNPDGSEEPIPFETPLEGVYYTQYKNAAFDIVLKFYFEKKQLI